MDSGQSLYIFFMWHNKELIRFCDLNFQGHHPSIQTVKNQWMDFDQTCVDKLFGGWKQLVGY